MSQQNINIKLLILLLISLSFAESENNEVITLTTHESVAVCEMQMNLNSHGHKNEKFKTCSLCFNVRQMNDVSLELDRSDTCTDLDLYRNKCRLDGQIMGSGKGLECDLKTQQNLALDNQLKALIFPVESSGLDISGVEFLVPTMFWPSSSFQFLRKKSLFNATNLTLSVKSIADSTWSSKSCGFVLLVTVATLNIIAGILLQKYDIDFDIKRDRLERFMCTTESINAPKLRGAQTPKGKDYVSLQNDLSENDAAQANEVVASNLHDAVEHEYGDDHDARCYFNEVDVDVSSEGQIGHQQESVERKKRKRCEMSDSQMSKFSSVCSIVVALVVTVTILLLLFFFHHVLWYVVVVMYVIWVCFSFSSFGSRLFDRFTFSMDLSNQKTSCIFFAKFAPGFLLGAALATCWLLMLERKWIWILWDLLSFSVCLYVLAQSRFPSFKWLTVLSVVFLAYDAIAVYVTPLFTESGKSVMEEAVVGSDSHLNEPSQFLPILFLAKLNTGEDSECVPVTYNILGMGDVIIPGFLILHASIFGLFKSAKPTKLYAAVSLAAYAMAYVIVFIFLMAMKSAQPVLVFVIPMLLMSIITLAACRNELKSLMKCDTRHCTSAKTKRADNIEESGSSGDHAERVSPS